MIDDYEPGRLIPYFAISLRLKGHLKPKTLQQGVNFIGAKERAYITLSRDPAPKSNLTILKKM